MKKRSLQLKDLQRSINEDMQNLVDSAVNDKGEVRELTTEEQTKMTDLQSRFDSLTPQITQAEQLEARKASEAAAGVPIEDGPSANEKRDLSKYSFVKLLRSEASKGSLEGLELEMHQEAVKEAQERGQSISGVGVPSMFYRISSKKEMEKRTTLTAGTAGTAGNLVATDLDAMVPALRPQLKVVEAGATVLNNLTGNLDIPRQSAVGAATWEGETDAAAETNLTTDKISLTPHRLAAFTPISLQMLNQGSLDVEALVREDLELALATALDAAAINGSGSGAIPEGLLNATGIGDVAMGTNGGAITWAKLIEAHTTIDEANALAFGEPTWLSTPGVRGSLLSTEKVSSTGIFLMDAMNMLTGYNALFSTQVPSTLTKGTSSGVCHAAILGAWSQMMIASWGLLDITVDNITQKKSGKIEIVVNSFHDIAVRRPEAFCAIKDITV